MIELYPAIDLRDGRAVRLTQGEFGTETVYSEDPVEVARGYAAAGAVWIHVVDLDAARTGEPVNLPLVAAIAGATGCAVQAGGGVRSPEAAERLLEAGVVRVVVGTAAVESPGLVADLAARHPGRVAAGLDARGRRLAVRGWTEESPVDLVEAARRLEGEGAAALIVTEIGRDGTMAGPDLDQLAAVLEATATDVIASGGVGTLEDLRALSALSTGTGGTPPDTGGTPPGPPGPPGGNRTLAGVIVGRALYEGRFSLQEALRCLAPA